jgi:hypothetical protein
MTQTLEFSDQDLKLLINTERALMGEMNRMQEQMGKMSENMETEERQQRESWTACAE